jgi:hypothetical protein
VTQAETRVVEVRCYTLKPGTSAIFHRLVTEASLPLLRDAGIEVVAFGPSLDEEHGYYLIRAFANVEDLRFREAAFYASAAWHEGPRQAVLACIEQYASAAIELPAAVVDGLRRGWPAPIGNGSARDGER